MDGMPVSPMLKTDVCIDSFEQHDGDDHDHHEDDDD